MRILFSSAFLLVLGLLGLAGHTEAAAGDPTALVGIWRGEINLLADARSTQMRADGTERTLVISRATWVEERKQWDVAAQYGIGAKLSPVNLTVETDEQTRIHFMTGAGARVELRLSDDLILSGFFTPKGDRTYSMRFKKVE